MTRVLVVEDEESFSDALSYMLRREGYETVVAADGVGALAEEPAPASEDAPTADGVAPVAQRGRA